MIQLQTAFGGGKTHTLLALYHLLTQPKTVAKVPDIENLVRAAGLKQVPTARVVCMVGTALNPLAILNRGYSVTLDRAGRVVHSVRAVRPGDRIRTRVTDGEFQSEVTPDHDA